MPDTKRIHVLDKHTAELIAAGEVVERPSSVIKELMENAIDAGAKSITVEIQNGGITLMRIIDDGIGIARDDVPTAFLRHATSKVRSEEDLDAIGTLGFRGEALASISAVARVELITRTADDLAATRYVIEGGEEVLLEDAARSQGTTIVVRDLFYNVPARMKFLKKDVSEANSVAGVVDRVALSHPEVSVRFVRDGREELLTPGDGKLHSCIYAVFGKDFANTLIPLDYALADVQVQGLICRPESGRANRTMQHFFINGRYVKTRTAMAALEEAYKGSMMVGKMPACVLHITMPLGLVDVNVHPAKIEVRFVNERPLFDAVYHGVKSAILAQSNKVSMTLPGKKPEEKSEPAPEQLRLQTPLARTTPSPVTDKPATAEENTASVTPPAVFSTEKPIALTNGFGDLTAGMAAPMASKPLSSLPLRDAASNTYPRGLNPPDISADDEDDFFQKPLSAKASSRTSDELTSSEPTTSPPALASSASNTAEPAADEPRIAVLGEVFSTYIVAQQGDALYFIDKHAAHERILYNQLKQGAQDAAQMLLVPVSVTLSREEYAALLTAWDDLAKAGFELEDFGGSSVLVRTVPMMLEAADASALIEEIAGGLAAGRREITTDKLDWIFHSTACRAAIKAGDISRPQELEQLACRVLLQEDVRTCPHGRPVCFEITRRELEKQFGRIQ